MKILPIHIFLILMGSLLLCCFLSKTKLYESMTTNTKTSQQVNSYTGPAGDTVYTYNTQPENTNDNSSQQVNSYTGPAGDTVYTYNTQPEYTNDNSTVVVTSAGVPNSQIPPGDEDLYILKTQVVPPVCPACPSISSCPRTEPPPPCPPCARCPEPAFECKKVPTYRINDVNTIPVPVLNDFSSFGM
jgi:hypothetical protein